MIQRIQSIYLLLVAICSALTLFFPFAHFYEGSVKLSEYAAFGVFNVQSVVLEMSSATVVPIWIFSILGTLLPLIIVFLYKNRKLQIKLVHLTYIIFIAFLILIYMGISNVSETLYSDGQEILYHIGFYLPVAAIAFLFLAIRGIKKDEALIRSIDRIR